MATAMTIRFSRREGNIERMAKAQLKARAEPNAKSQYKVDIAKAKAANSVAREKCDDLVGEARSVCNQRAKSNYARARDRAAAAR